MMLLSTSVCTYDISTKARTQRKKIKRKKKVGMIPYTTSAASTGLLQKFKVEKKVS